MRPALLLLVVLLLALTRAAHGDPALARVLTAPTAWVPPAATVLATAGVDHRGAGLLQLSYGLGDLASVELGTDTDVRGCTSCPGPQARWLGRAGFRIGARADAWVRGMPALALGVRTTFAAPGGAFERARVSELSVVASRVLGPVRVHAGAAIHAAGFADIRLAGTARPLAGLEWTPARYPRTSLLGDIAWVPRLEPAAIQLEWLAGWGVRYQAVRWGSIELAVRHREAEGLAASTVLVRLNGVWAGRAP